MAELQTLINKHGAQPHDLEALRKHKPLGFPTNPRVTVFARISQGINELMFYLDGLVDRVFLLVSLKYGVDRLAREGGIKYRSFESNVVALKRNGVVTLLWRRRVLYIGPHNICLLCTLYKEVG